MTTTPENVKVELINVLETVEEMRRLINAVGCTETKIVLDTKFHANNLVNSFNIYVNKILAVDPVVLDACMDGGEPIHTELINGEVVLELMKSPEFKGGVELYLDESDSIRVTMNYRTETLDTLREEFNMATRPHLKAEIFKEYAITYRTLLEEIASILGDEQLTY